MAKLTPKDRDELLIRLDERVKDMREDTLPAIEQHLAGINNHLDDHSRRLVIVETRVEERTASKVSKKAIVGYSSGGLLVLAITILQIIQMLSG